MKINYSKIFHILTSIDWVGHAEYSVDDLRWLATALAAKLQGPAEACEACGQFKELVIETKLGFVCETCSEGIRKDFALARGKLERG